ncbi:MAG: hypothetical protein N2652_04210 [Kiritimatiellae bacterium]|nr:hypothetical protein [Kiritimatiellia bacterium]
MSLLSKRKQAQMKAKEVTALIRKIFSAKTALARHRTVVAQLERQIDEWSRRINQLLAADVGTPAEKTAAAPVASVGRRDTTVAKTSRLSAEAPARKPKSAAAKTLAAPGSPATTPKMHAKAARTAKGRRVTIREAVLKILEQKSPVSVNEIREGIRKLGGATKSLYVALSRMAKDKVIESAGRGLYRLPNSSKSSTGSER